MLLGFEGRNVRYGKAIRIQETGEIFVRGIDCAERLSVSKSTVTACLNGQLKTCAGYHLEIIDYKPKVDLDSNMWDEHPVYGGIFVSKDGNVVSYKSGRQYALTKQKTPNGYIGVGIGHSNNQFVHKLVTETFIPNPENNHVVHHKDGNRENNSVDNLEWTTSSENVKRTYTEGKHQYHLKPVHVLETGVTYKSIRDCANDMNLSEKRIGDCVRGVREQYQGYHFEEVKE